MFHLADIENNPNATSTDIENARLAGYRTRLMVPMVRGDRTLGLIAVTREDPTPFSDQLVELLRTFADQAVIAIENARLFEEVQARTRELSVALERQTATSEILGIISASPGRLEPVFDAILARARELCAAKFGHLLLFDGQAWRPAALHNVPRAYAEFWHNAPAVAFPGTLLWHLRETKQPFQLEDSRLGKAYRARIPLAVATVELGGARTLLGVPLLKDGQVIGAIVLYRGEVLPFDDQQIGLLSSFAAQAVIAIENARLLADLQERQRELARSVEELKSLGAVSQTVNSTLELAKVLPAILEHACAMSYANGGTIYVFDTASGEFHLAAGHNMSEEHIARVRAQPIRLGDVVVGECAERREAVQIADLDTAPALAAARHPAPRRRARRPRRAPPASGRGHRRPGRPPQPSGRLLGGDHPPARGLCRAVGRRRAQCAPVRGGRAEGPAARHRQPAQVAVRRQHEP